MEREDGYTQKIYDTAVICSTLFELCVNSSAAISSNHDFAIELRGRFNLWAAYVGAFAAPKASLDARLIAHGDIRDMVVDLLVMIQANMRHVLESSNDTKPDSEHMSSEDSSLLPGLNAVETALGRLHSLAIAIRRSAIRSHKQKINLDAPVADERLVYLDLVRRRFKHAKESLVDQLGTSIHFRGRSMYYQQRHNRKIAEKRSAKEAVIQSNTEENVEDAQPETSTTIDIPQRSPNAHAFMSETNASELDKQDLLTRLRNARPTYSIISKGSSVQESQDNRFDYPKMPRSKDSSSSVLCPLCSEPLDPLTFTLKTWQDHVDRDIEPYVCISEECKEPLQFFVHHRDWKEHMQRMHTLYWPQIVHTTMWYCDLHHSHEEFDRKDNFLEHLSTKHTLTRPQILARIRRNKLLTTREPFICPLCDDRPEDVALHISDKPYGLLFTHIAQHLKALAFYSLSYLDFDGASSEDSPVEDGQIDGVDISRASRRSSVVKSFGEIPENETLESGGMRVVCAEVFADGGMTIYEHHFQEPPESEDPAWNRIPRQDYPEYDQTLETFAAAMNGRPGTAFLSLTDKIFSECVESNFDSEVIPFLPAGRIDRLVTPGAIIEEFQAEDNVGTLSYLVEFVLGRARIVFALAVLCGLKGTDLISSVSSFLEANFADSSLPIEGDHFFRDRAIWSRQRIHSFYQQQWTFLAPVFSRQHFKISLQRKHILPILKTNDVKKGAFSRIFQVEIHPDHQKDLINNKDGSLAKLAIKEFKVPSYDAEPLRDATEAWTSEIQMIEEIGSLRHPHLQECLAAITRGTQYYQLVHWADGGNLREFWHDNPKPIVTADLVRTIIGQFRGLADALKSLHYYEKVSSRHGDIKPENILVFLAQDRDKIGTLKLTRLGSAKHHYMSSRFREPSPKIFYNYTYQPPESVTDKVSAWSRLPDLWSMGCVLLEFMVWLLYGWKELEAFNASIQGELVRASHFFTVNEDVRGPVRGPVAQVHPAVEACLDGLARDPECGPTTALGDLLRIIRTKLLVVDFRRPAQELIAPPENASVTVETASPVPGHPTGWYRANSFELLNALDGILQGRGAVDERYWFTGQPRENLRLHRPIPKVVMDDNSSYLSPKWTPKHGTRRDNLKVPQPPLSDVSLTFPSIHVQELSDEWLYPVDNAFATRVLEELGSSALPTFGFGSTKLCSKCGKMDLSEPIFRIQDTWSELESNCVNCDFCMMRLEASKHLDRKEYPSARFEKTESLLRMTGNSSPVFSIFRQLGLNPSFLQIGSFQVGIPLLPYPGSHHHVTIMRQWLKNCDENHHCRPSSKTFLPTRLLNIGSIGSATIHLYETQASDSLEYLALSHPWGQPPYFYTHHSNIANYKRGIDISDLPLTFGHAVAITRELGFRYLWIDAICIVQGPDGDFFQEANRVEEVFSSASCVLNASSARSQSDGFLIERKSKTFVNLKNPGQPDIYVCPFIDDFEKYVLKAPLNQRAWVLQERLLAHRTIYFSETQTFWECGEGVRCETLTKAENKLESFFGDPNFPEKLASTLTSKREKIIFYQDLFKRYSRLDLTNSEDRPIAIAGLEKRLIRDLNIQGGFGIFDDGASLLMRSLLWQRGNEEKSLRRIKFSPERNMIVPSWSWMAFSGGIDFLHVPFGFVDWQIDEMRSPFAFTGGSEVQESTVFVLSAVARDFEISKRSDSELNLIYDEPEYVTRRHPKCIVVGRQRRESVSTARHYVILISALEESPNRYERIGVGYMPGIFIQADPNGQSQFVEIC